MKKNIIYLVLIILLGFFLRFYHVGDNPQSPLVDEASIGYNAYSILHTGKDEFGKALPLTFKAFGDQKLPAYIYATVPSVAVFGLNNFAVRFPSVIFGTLLILVTYLLLKELKFNEPLSLLGALITATSPWTVIMSRFGYESNMGLFFFMLGIYFLVKGYRRNKNIFLILGGLCFGFTWYCYIAFRLVSTAIIGLVLLFGFFKRKLSIRSLFFILFAFVVITLPFYPTFLSKAGTARLTQVGLFSNPGIPMEIIQDRTYCTESLPKLLCYALYAKPIIYAREITDSLSKTFSLNYLFLKGEDIRYVSVENFGLFFIFLAPFYVAGLFQLFKKIKEKRLIHIFFAIGALIAASPSLLVGNLFRVRLTPLFPFLLLLLVEGLSFIKLYKHKYQLIFFRVISVLFIAFSFFFITQLLTIHTKKFEAAYQAFIPGTMQYLSKLNNKTPIYVENYFSEPAVYFAYYKKIDPKIYQKTVKLGQMEGNGFQHVVKVENFNVVNRSAVEIACLHQNEPNAVILTQNKMSTNYNAQALYMFTANTGLPTYAFIYRIQDVLTPQVDCPSILKPISN